MNETRGAGKLIERAAKYGTFSLKSQLSLQLTLHVKDTVNPACHVVFSFVIELNDALRDNLYNPII
jgi:hypothetical protein